MKDGFGGLKVEKFRVKVMQNFAEILKIELSKGLPGTDVQWQMAPRHRFSEFPTSPGKDTLDAAVLILLYPHLGSVYTILTQRQSYDGVHSGQISFPGGKREPADKSDVHTALREAEEEIGIDSSQISVFGTLTPLFIPVSNILVTSVIGWVKNKPEFIIDPKEVALLIDADLKTLIDPAIVKIKPYEIRGSIIEVKYFDYDDNMIWGATAMILQELLVIIKNSGVFDS